MRFFTAIVAFAQVAVILAAPLPNEAAKKTPSPYSKVGGDADAPMYETALPVNAGSGETITVD
ncbi:hypothetical protein K505DRAFT_358508 [Melanomma pulvis-pyrius CBS 109.77]|uniref:Uncharacterized protein n=1 Tax=Melanomma pulvis-pyrius CBS 109.77 TaxID=1314802 RepID=A0A6A6XM45_9PLEO|nr:hypothetical protein K505DRAFT_358508 [Melanomma pulvis-pyrius CBS 109.77]